ncbi:MAG: hypothetical protein IJ261_01940 [Clostridia bacterium]|nr:hypothetical protein [Clostridia bacterium]
MKNIKKIVALLLAISILAGAFVFSASANTQTETEEEVIVARMYIGHRARDNNLSGHTWIYIENLTDHELVVGVYKLAPGKGVSVGTYGTSVKNGPGVYYNVEAWRYRNYTPEGCIASSKDLTQENFDIVSKKIRSTNTWSYFLNCGYFALKVWNSVPGNSLLYLIWPTMTHIQLLATPDHFYGFDMTVPTTEQCYRMIGTGSDATLEIADPTY